MLPHLFRRSAGSSWLAFFLKEKKKSASCSEVSAGSGCFITESCHILMALNFAAGVEKQKRKKIGALWGSVPVKRKSPEGIKLSISWEWRLHSGPWPWRPGHQNVFRCLDQQERSAEGWVAMAPSDHGLLVRLQGGGLCKRMNSDEKA